MSELAEHVRTLVASWDDAARETIDVREQPGRHGTLIFAASATAGDEHDRWFSARALYVDAATRQVFRLPGHVADLPAAETFLANPENRNRCAIPMSA